MLFRLYWWYSITTSEGHTLGYVECDSFIICVGKVSALVFSLTYGNSSIVFFGGNIVPFR
jgi:hypothetical protein